MFVLSYCGRIRGVATASEGDSSPFNFGRTETRITIISLLFIYCSLSLFSQNSFPFFTFPIISILHMSHPKSIIQIFNFNQLTHILIFLFVTFFQDKSDTGFRPQSPLGSKPQWPLLHPIVVHVPRRQGSTLTPTAPHLPKSPHPKSKFKGNQKAE